MNTCAMLMIVAAAAAVPPGAIPVNHNQPYHDGAPVSRQFERFGEDSLRQCRWENYSRRLQQAWNRYRQAGSTSEAWHEYKRELAAAKRDYVFQDIYLVPLPAPPQRPVDTSLPLEETLESPAATSPMEIPEAGAKLAPAY